MSRPQLTAHSEHRPTVTPSVQSDFRHEPPQTFTVAVDYEPCRLRTGCCLLAYGTVCGQLCYARLIG